MKGFDISSNNSYIDFEQAKAEGYEVCFIKATEGTSYISSSLHDQYNRARNCGFKIGFYHFVNTSDANEQANHFLSAISGLTADCKYMIDIEDDTIFNISTASSITRKIADILIANGKIPCLYSGDYFYRDVLNSSVKDIPLVVAKYGGIPMADCYCGIQYTETGSITGCTGNIDLDWFDDGILLPSVVSIQPIVTPIIKEEVIDMGTIICYGNNVDQRFAESLADAMNAPTIFSDRAFDYSKYSQVICVGGHGALPWTGYATKIIAGNGRVETEQAVLDFIKNGCK